MCSLCLKTPCDSRCPNAPEPKPVVNCKECGVGIFEGERFYDSEKGPICEDCMDDMTVLIWLASRIRSLYTSTKMEFKEGKRYGNLSRNYNQ